MHAFNAQPLRTTHNAPRTTHNAPRTTHAAQRTRTVAHRYAQQLQYPHAAALHASALMLFSRHKSLLPRLHAIATSAQLTLNCRQQRPTTRRRHLPYCTLANAAQSTSERPTRARQWHYRLLVQRNCQMAQSRHTISLIDCCQSAGTCASQPHVLQDGGIVGLRYDQGHRANRGVAASVHCATRRQNAAARLEQSKRIMHIMRNNAPKMTRQLLKNDNNSLEHCVCRCGRAE